MSRGPSKDNESLNASDWDEERAIRLIRG